MRAHEIFGWTEVPNHTYFEQQTEADGWAVHIYNLRGFVICLIPEPIMS